MSATYFQMAYETPHIYMDKANMANVKNFSSKCEMWVVTVVFQFWV